MKPQVRNITTTELHIYSLGMTDNYLKIKHCYTPQATKLINTTQLSLIKNTKHEIPIILNQKTNENITTNQIPPTNRDKKHYRTTLLVSKVRSTTQVQLKAPYYYWAWQDPSTNWCLGPRKHDLSCNGLHL